MNEPVWVTEEDCLSFHDKLLARFGGAAGVRDRGLLLSALARPQHMHAYESPSLFDLAAAYAHGIVKNHPFLDGNKRSGLLAAALFLEANGIRFHGDERGAVIQTLALAAGESTLQDFSAWLQRVSVKPRPEPTDAPPEDRN
ncbi:MAG: type II toxin-antitoxin system death-on-curing family toxin [Planctomycetia bacterium]